MHERYLMYNVLKIKANFAGGSLFKPLTVNLCAKKFLQPKSCVIRAMLLLIAFCWFIVGLQSITFARRDPAASSLS